MGTLGIVVAALAAVPLPARGQGLDPLAMVADQLVQRVEATLAGASTPRDDQFTRAAILFDMALHLAPQAGELWRLRHELARQTGDRPKQLEALRRYCELAPQDDAAQLELIAASHDQRQTLEDRVAAVRGLLDSQDAASLSAPLRSRLASYVAEGAAEIGDLDQFRQYVGQAISLDSTNKHAAQMAFDYVKSQRAASAVEVGASLFQLAGADPFDARARLELARLMLTAGLYLPAAEQFAVAHQIEAQWSNDPVVFDWALSLAGAGAINPALSVLGGATRSTAAGPGPGAGGAGPEAGATEPAPATPPSPDAAAPESNGAAAAPDADKAPAGATPPAGAGMPESGTAAPDAAAPDAAAAKPAEPVAVKRTLPLDLELLRLAILHAAGATAAADGAYGRIAGRLTEQVKAGDMRAAADLVWMAQLFDREGPREQELLEKLEGSEARDPVMLQRIRGWRAFHRGAHDEAAAILDPLAPADRHAAYGLALCAKTQPEQVAALTAIVNAGRADLPGLLAVLRLRQIGGPVEPSDQGARLGQMYGQWPSTIRSPNPQASPPVRVSLLVEPKRFGYLDPIWAYVQIRNDSDVPLAMGDRGPAPANLFLIASAANQGEVREQAPIVIDMRRRLMLPPRSSLVLATRLDHSVLGAALSRAPTDTVGLSVKAMLDPRTVPGEPIAVGWLGSTDVQRALERVAMQPTPQDLTQWIAEVDEADPAARLRALARLVQMGPYLGDAAEMKSYTQRIGETIGQRFPQLAEHEQVWVCMFLGIDDKSRELFKAVHEAAQRSPDPGVQITYLASAVIDPESPAINAALRSENPVIRQFADAHRTGIIKTREMIMAQRTAAMEAQRRRQ